MDVREALHRNRSCRRFYQDTAVPASDLDIIADAARLSPSGRNIQALKFLLSNDRELNARIFPTLAWAGYLPDWPGPVEGERPAAYIVQLLDTGIASSTICDEGITAQSMLLQAVELGYGGCIIAAVKRNELHRILELPDHLKILNVIALGRPKETVVIEDMKEGEYRYWRTPDGVHHVPKRSLKEITLRKYLRTVIMFLALLPAISGCHKPTPGAGNLGGRVTFSDGSGLEGVSVIYGDSAILTSSNGEYLYEALPEGLQGIRFALSGYYPVTELVYIPNGGTAECSVQLDIITAGWAAGAEDSGYGTILRTADAGISWIRQGTPSIVPAARLTDVCAVSDQICWIAGDADTVRNSTVILRTEDAGTTWTNQGTRLSSIPPVSIAAIISLDGDTAWAVTADTCLVLKTTDAGNSWNVCRTSDAVTGYTAVTTVDGISVWCSGKSSDGSAVVEYSPDGGVTWTAAQAGTYATQIPTDICALPGPVLFMTGLNSTGVLTSSDAGSTWRQVMGYGASLLCLEAMDGNRLWAAGGDGCVIRTSDGFQTHLDGQPAQSAFPGGNVSSVAFLRDGMRGAFSIMSSSGASGSIYYTRDGGENWTGSSVPFSFSIESLDFVGGNN